VYWHPFAVARKRFEQEATEGTEMDWILCCLGFLLWVWNSRRIRPNGMNALFGTCERHELDVKPRKGER